MFLNCLCICLSAITHPISSYGPPTAAAYHYSPPTAPSIHYGPPIHHEVAAAGPVYGPPIGHNSIYGGNKFTSAFEGICRITNINTKNQLMTYKGFTHTMTDLCIL